MDSHKFNCHDFKENVMEFYCCYKNPMIVFLHLEKHVGFEGRQYVQVICTFIFYHTDIRLYNIDYCQCHIQCTFIDCTCNAHLSMAQQCILVIL